MILDVHSADEISLGLEPSDQMPADEAAGAANQCAFLLVHDLSSYLQ